MLPGRERRWCQTTEPALGPWGQEQRGASWAAAADPHPTKVTGSHVALSALPPRHRVTPAKVTEAGHCPSLLHRGRKPRLLPSQEREAWSPNPGPPAPWALTACVSTEGSYQAEVQSLSSLLHTHLRLCTDVGPSSQLQI